MGAALSSKSPVPDKSSTVQTPAKQHVNAVDASVSSDDAVFPHRMVFNGSHYDFFIVARTGQPMETVLAHSLLYLNFTLKDHPQTVDSLLLPSRQGVFEGHLFRGRLSALITVKHVIHIILYTTAISSNLTLVLIDKYAESRLSGRKTRERLSPTYIVAPFYCPASFARSSPAIFCDVRSIFRQGIAVNKLIVGGFGKSVTFRSVHLHTSEHRLSIYATQHPHGESPADSSWSAAQEALLRDTVSVMPLIWHRPESVIAQMSAHDPAFSKYDIPVVRWRRIAGIDDPNMTLLCSTDASMMEEALLRREARESIDEPALVVIFFADTPYQMHWDLRFPHMTAAFARQILEYFEALFHDAARSFRQAIPQDCTSDIAPLLTPNRSTKRYRLRVRRSDPFTDVISRFMRVPLILQRCIPQLRRVAETPFTCIPQVVFDGEAGLDAGGLLKELLVNIARDIQNAGLFVRTSGASEHWTIAPENGVADLAICQALPSATRITTYRILGHLMAVAIIKGHKFPLSLSPALLFVLMHCIVPSAGAYYYGEAQHSSTLMALKDATTQFLRKNLMGRQSALPSRYVSYLEAKGRALIGGAFSRGTVPSPFPDVKYGPWSVGIASLSLHPYDALALYCLEADSGSAGMEAGYLLFPDLAAINMDGCLDTTLQASSVRSESNLQAFNKLVGFYRKRGYMFYNLDRKGQFPSIPLISTAVIAPAPNLSADDVPTMLLSDSSDKDEPSCGDRSHADYCADGTLPRNKGPIYACQLAYSRMIGLVFYEACALADGMHSLLRMVGINLANEQIPVTYLYRRFFAQLEPVSFTKELILRHFRFEDASIGDIRTFIRVCLEFTAKEQSSLLRFCTGIPYFEPNVLIAARFSLPKGYLPQGRTCANILELPKDASYDELICSLRSAIEHTYYGFL